MQQRLLIQILAILALFSATLALDPSLTFNTTLLCTERYWLQINFEGVVGNQVIFAGGSGTQTRYLTYTLTSESGSVGTYVVYDPSLTYFAQMTNGGSPVYQIELTVAACTGLTTNGLTAGKQAVWVADVYRKDTDVSARGYFWNSNLQAAADAIFSPGSTVCDSASNFASGGVAFLQSKGYDPVSAYCLMVSGSNADAGGLIQGIPSFLSSNWGTFDEVAFAQNTASKKWVMLLARRQRSLNCGNKFRAVDYEDCDDGNTDSLDGCSNTCVVESGWTCSENVLQEGSTCARAPAAPTAPVAGPVAVPTSSPTAQTPTAGTPTAVPTSAPTAAPTAGTPTSVPTSSPTATPQAQTPTSVPTSAPASSPTAAPTSSPSAAPQIQTPTSAPSSAPSSSPSAVPQSNTPSGQTPSSSPQSETPSSGPNAAPSSETPSSSPSGSSPSATPNGSFTPSDAPSFTPSIVEPVSPRPSRTPDSNAVNGSEKITASLMVIVTVLSAIAAF